MKSNTIYLITGISGNLGSSVASRLLADGKSVRGLVLKGDPAAIRVPQEVDVRLGNVTDKDSIDSFFEADAGTELVVIHCAAIVTVNPKFSQKVYDVNVTGTQNIIDACIKHMVKKLVHVSSVGAIPEAPRGTAIREPRVFDPKAVVGYYGETKAIATNAVLRAVHDHCLDASIVFPSGICGPEDYTFGMVASFIMDYCAGKMPAGVAGSFNAVDVRDLANAIVSCVDNGKPGKSYILGNDCVTLKEMFGIISRQTGVPEVKMILPVWAAKILGVVSDIIEKTTGKPQRMTSYAVYNLIRNNVFDSSKAQRELGFCTRPFEDTIADTIRWLEREGKLQTVADAECR